MYNASLYAALLLGYTIHFIYCIWGNLSFIAKAPLQGNSNGMPRHACCADTCSGSCGCSGDSRKYDMSRQAPRKGVALAMT